MLPEGSKDAIESFRLLSDENTDNKRIAEELDTCNRERQKLQTRYIREIISKYDPGASLIGKKDIYRIFTGMERGHTRNSSIRSGKGV